ncbi:hypothetical protein ABZ721_14860 [Streptomyces sp. NPDC006733]|uniref:hypothetical protein n=1 Tax=Streptomyces sp. NPDC006733 TaxID=3155460 RepID=UPI003404483F
MTRSRALQPLAVWSPLLAAAVVLGAPDPAVAQCAAPNYRGGRSLPSGGCPTHAAATASATVWAVLALVGLAWLLLAIRRGRDVTDADLAVVDAGFAATAQQEAPTGQQAAP